LLPQLRRLRDPGFPSWCELRSCLLRSHRVSAEITWNAGDFRHEWQTPVVGVNIVEGQPYSCAPGQPRGFEAADVSPGWPCWFLNSGEAIFPRTRQAVVNPAPRRKNAIASCFRSTYIMTAARCFRSAWGTRAASDSS
jgi:hypothetical protein